MATQNSIGNQTYSLTSDTGITATTGNVTATAGNLVSTLGDLVLTNGKISIGADTGTDGYVLVAATGANPAWSAITAAAGSGITVTLGANTIALASTSPFAWSTIDGDGALAVDQGRINIKVAALSVSLPASSSVGDIIAIKGSATGAGGWTLTQGANQYVWVQGVSSTVGAGGSIASSDAHDYIMLICTVADLGWESLAVGGNITVV